MEGAGRDACTRWIENRRLEVVHVAHIGGDQRSCWSPLSPPLHAGEHAAEAWGVAWKLGGVQEPRRDLRSRLPTSVLVGDDQSGDGELHPSPDRSEERRVGKECRL